MTKNSFTHDNLALTVSFCFSSRKRLKMWAPGCKCSSHSRYSINVKKKTECKNNITFVQCFPAYPFTQALSVFIGSLQYLGINHRNWMMYQWRFKMHSSSSSSMYSASFSPVVFSLLLWRASCMLSPSYRSCTLRAILCTMTACSMNPVSMVCFLLRYHFMLHFFFFFAKLAWRKYWRKYIYHRYKDGSSCCLMKY